MEGYDNYAQILVGNSGNEISALQLQVSSLILNQENHNLKWERKDHQPNIISNMISMFRSGELSDTILIIEGSHFLCHKLLLAASSPYFYTMFTSSLKESSLLEIPIQGIKKKIFQDVLQYLYCGEVVINAENVQGLLHASDIFILDTLKEGCVEFYQQYISSDNCLGIWQFSEQCNANILQHQSFQYALKNFPEVYKNQEFLDLPTCSLIAYLQHKDLYVEVEDQICDALVQWLQHSPKTRADHLMSILPQLQLLTQNARMIKQKLLNNTVLQKNNDAVQFLEGILNHLLYSEPLPKGTILRPVRNFSPYPQVCVILGGYTAGRRSKLCHVANYQESAQSITTSTICEVPTQYNIEMASCVVNNIMYTCGCGELANEIWKLDMNRTLWTRCCNMIFGRICHTIIAGPKVDECFYILGGYNQCEDAVLDDIEMHEINKNQSSSIGLLAKATACCCAQYYDGMIYTFGGVTEEERPSALVQMLNTDTKQCTLLPIKLPSPSHRLRSILCVNKIIALGLKTSFVIDIVQFHNIFKNFNPEENRQINDDYKGIIQSRKGVNKDLFGLHLLGDKLLMFGGRILEDDSDLTDIIEIMQVTDYLSSDDTKWKYIGRLPFSMAMYTTGVMFVKSSFVKENCGFTSL